MLADALKTLLASNFAYYLKAQQFHWNVEGPDFGEFGMYHGHSLSNDLRRQVDKHPIHIRRIILICKISSIHSDALAR